MHHAFLYISLLSLHDYKVKVPNFTCCRGCEHKTMTSFFPFLNFDTVFLEFSSRKISQHLTN